MFIIWAKKLLQKGFTILFIKFYNKTLVKSTQDPSVIWSGYYRLSDISSALERILSFRGLYEECPAFFEERNDLFIFQNKSTNSNILMELAKNAKDDALRELLVNRQTYRWEYANFCKISPFFNTGMSLTKYYKKRTMRDKHYLQLLKLTGM